MVDLIPATWARVTNAPVQHMYEFKITMKELQFL